MASTTTAQARLPVLFASHGSPMLAVDETLAAAFKAWGKALPRPSGILAFSAHWETDTLICGETARHTELIYDFGGFPDALYELQYPAPGAPWLADRVRELLIAEGEMPKLARGLDHGVWVPLLHLWPGSDIPVLQMSLPRSLNNEGLFMLGARLAPLREQGIIILCSGAATHNLQAVFSQHYATTPPWASDFDHWLEQTLLYDRRALVHWETTAPHATDNHPTPEHFRPLLIAAGAAADEDSVRFPVTGYELAIISRRSVQFG